jgi:hypothetical protein
MAVCSQTRPRGNGKPSTLGRGAVRRFVAVDQAKSGLPFTRRDIEPDPAAVCKLRVESGSHELADERVAFAFDQQLSDAAFQRFGFVLAGLIILSGSRG